MNWLKSILSRKALNKVSSTLNESNIEIPQSLFLDNQSPVLETHEEMHKENALEDFLNQDYFNMGYEAGFQYHSSEVLEHTIRKFKSQYILLIDMFIDEKSSEMGALKIHKAEIEELSPKTLKQIDSKLIDLEKLISKITEQKELTVEDEGWIMVPVNIFRLGFIQGLEKYHEVKTFATSTGLFN